MFNKTMTFCKEGVVQADPPPPSYGQRPHFYIFFWTLTLVHLIKLGQTKGLNTHFLVARTKTKKRTKTRLLFGLKPKN